MLVNNFTRASHVCNQTFIEGNVIIKCGDPLVIGCRLTIVTSFNNEDQINDKVLIDICTNTMCKKTCVIDHLYILLLLNK